MLLLLLAVTFLGIAGHDLWTPDEPREASVCRAMLASKDWVVPLLAGEPFVEKPPLFYILCSQFAARMESLLGFIGGARLFIAFCSLGTLIALWLMAWMMRNRTTAWLAVLSLGTMGQYVADMHWLRVDPLLAFFVMATLACFTAVFVRRRMGWAWLGGFFAAGAFLTKGPIGVILIGFGWAALAWPRLLVATERTIFRSGRFWIGHLGAGLLMIGLSAVWIWALWRRGDAQAWAAWLVDNQFGRFTGAGATLGHHHPGAVGYYPANLLHGLLPWTPLAIYWLVWRGRQAWQSRLAWRDWVSSAPVVWSLWGLGATIFLSVPVTKRAVYLLPVLPAYALMCADALSHFSHATMPRWMRVWFAAWVGLVCASLILLGLLPLLAPWLPLPTSLVVQVLTRASVAHGVTLILGAGLILWLWRRPATPPSVRWFTATAIFWIAVFLVPFQALDAAKSLGPAYAHFAQALPPAHLHRIAAWNVDETTRAGLQFYGGIVLPRLPPNPDGYNQMVAILKGEDSQIDAVVAQAGKKSRPNWPQSAILLHQYRINAKRTLQLLAAPHVAKQWPKESASRADSPATNPAE